MTLPLPRHAARNRAADPVIHQDRAQQEPDKTPIPPGIKTERGDEQHQLLGTLAKSSREVVHRQGQRKKCK